MPVLSRFYGIIIRMYFSRRSITRRISMPCMAKIYTHSDSEAKGYLPPKALAMVREWVAIHRNDLLQIWETQEFKQLPPLE